MGRPRIHTDLPRGLGRDNRTKGLRYKRPDNGRQIYLSGMDEALAIRLAEVLNAAFGMTPPRGMRHVYRQQFQAYPWATVDRELAAMAAVKLADIMPMLRGVGKQEEIRHSWAYAPPTAAAHRHGLKPLPKMSRAWIEVLFKTARKNAKAREIAFELTIEDLTEMVVASGGRCAVTGITLSREHGTLPQGRKMRRPWAPSLDRIDSHLGYTKENCRLVCCAANFAMSQWGEEVLVEMAKAIARKRITRLDRVAAG
jgi:hypothetical protein